METAPLKDLKNALQSLKREELLAVCLRLAKFKKENKELLTYLLFESENESNYVASIQGVMDGQFKNLTQKSPFWIRKGIRKILATCKRYIRYTDHKESEIELLLYFCEQMRNFRPSIMQQSSMVNVYHRQLALIEKKISALHEDLQYDYRLQLEALQNDEHSNKF